MSTVVKDLGPVTAYADAVAAGYTGTKEEWQALMASYASVAEEAQEAKEGAEAAQEAAESAKDAAIDAKEGAEDAVDGFGAVVTQATNQAVQTVRAEGTTQVGNVSSEGTTQVNAVQAKGAEVLQSIPADYTELSNDVVQLKEDLSNLESDGVVASSKQLLSDKYALDQVPYQFRATGGDGADREYDEIVGGSIVWNQKMSAVSYTNSDTDTKTVLSLRVRLSASPYTNLFQKNVSATGVFAQVSKCSFTGSFQILHSGSTKDLFIYTSAVDNKFEENHVYLFSGNFSGVDPTTVGGLQVDKVMIFDLTAMFGTTIADYIYSLEQATAGAGVAFFKKFFPKDYYAYDAGTMMHVSDLQSHDISGKNLLRTVTPTYGGLNITKNSDGSYSIKGTTSESGSIYFWNNANDPIVVNEDSIFTSGWNPSSQATYIFGTKDSTIAIEEAQSATINIPKGEYTSFRIYVAGNRTYDFVLKPMIRFASVSDATYEPYTKHSYPLDDSLTLRGIPKLDANNQLYYDGDIYSADGTVTRKYGVRAYQSGDASDGSTMVTDGTNTVYKLTTPTTETATPFTNPQICDPYGTEEYVTTSLVPVGHYTKYPANLRSAIERVMEQVPEAPSANGTYTLKATKTSNGVTYAWVAE